MTWVRLDDGFVRHPRMVAAGLHGRALFIAGLCYCGAHLTDGHIPKAVLPVLAAEAGVKPSTWRKLVEVGSWVDHGEHLEVHDYLVYNPSRSKVLGERSSNARRQALQRDPDLRELVRDRDADLCRYCGQTVNWKDRRGPRSGTYDHVDPGGPNTADNLVVACRSCNAAKRDRTLSDCGMVLLPPRTKMKPGSYPSPSLVTDQVSADPPSHPIPSPELSSSSNNSSNAPPGDHDDDPDEPLWGLLAQRRADQEHPGGDGIRQPAVYMKALVNDHRERFADQAGSLRQAHPTWTLEQLADALDPDTATDSRNYMNADDTADWIAQHDAKAAQAVPVPDHLKSAVR